jgi:AcrR family transcriptional regulator
VDKRIKIGKEKFNLAHNEIILITYNLLKIKSFSNINFNAISKLSNYSKTTLYEHFDSDINLLYLETLLLYQKKLISTFKYLDDPINNIINIYKAIFDFANSEPKLFKNMHMIAINLNTIGKNEYKYKSRIFLIIRENYNNLDFKLNFIQNWSLATLLCLQINNADFDFEYQKKQFFKSLKKDLIKFT